MVQKHWQDTDPVLTKDELGNVTHVYGFAIDRAMSASAYWNEASRVDDEALSEESSKILRGALYRKSQEDLWPLLFGETGSKPSPRDAFKLLSCLSGLGWERMQKRWAETRHDPKLTLLLWVLVLRLKVLGESWDDFLGASALKQKIHHLENWAALSGVRKLVEDWRLGCEQIKQLSHYNEAADQGLVWMERWLESKGGITGVPVTNINDVMPILSRLDHQKIKAGATNPSDKDLKKRAFLSDCWIAWARQERRSRDQGAQVGAWVSLRSLVEKDLEGVESQGQRQMLIWLDQAHQAYRESEPGSSASQEAVERLEAMLSYSGLVFKSLISGTHCPPLLFLDWVARAQELNANSVSRPLYLNGPVFDGDEKHFLQHIYFGVGVHWLAFLEEDANLKWFRAHPENLPKMVELGRQWSDQITMDVEGLALEFKNRFEERLNQAIAYITRQDDLLDAWNRDAQSTPSSSARLRF